MSTATIPRTPVTARVTPDVRRPVRPGSVRGPLARPRTLPAPGGDAGQRPRVRSCRIEATGGTTEWRLTDRGIAVVLVLALMITMAAAAVIGLTAWQVTGADYATWSAETVRSQ